MMFIKDYAGRIRLLHLKDYRITPVVQPEEDISTPEGMMKAYAAINDIFQFVEVCEGTTSGNGGYVQLDLDSH